MAGSAVWDADSPIAKSKTVDAVEELHQNLVRAMEEDQAMRAQVEDHMRHLDQQTIRRKSAEAGLFNTNADILRLRAQALQQEARVTRLANELRRVYKHLPRVVDQRLAQSSDARDKMMHQELAHLRETHRQEHFKFMDCHQIDHEHDIIQDQCRRQKMNQNMRMTLGSLCTMPRLQLQVLKKCLLLCTPTP